MQLMAILYKKVLGTFSSADFIVKEPSQPTVENSDLAGLARPNRLMNADMQRLST